MMLVSLQANIPRYYLEAYRGEGELGIFTALAYLMAVGNVVIQALGQSASPRLARYHATGDRAAFWRLLGRLLAVGLVAGVGGLLLVSFAGAPLLRLLYTEEYARHVGLLGLLMLAAAVSYLTSFLGCAMTAARAYRAQVPLFALVAAATAAGCQVGVPRYGMRGAAWGLVVAAGIQLVGSVVVLLTGRKPRGGRYMSDGRITFRGSDAGERGGANALLAEGVDRWGEST
jgi:O-antigen/teichoic acid export membrane protein